MGFFYFIQTIINIFIVISIAVDIVTRVQILDKVGCISHSTNILGKAMNPIIPLLAMGKY